MEKIGHTNVTVVVDSRPVSDFLSKYKYNTLIASGRGETCVEIDTTNKRQTIGISGPTEEVRKVKRKVDNILHRVKSNRFVLAVDTTQQDLALATESANCETEYIATVEHISSLSPKDRSVLLPNHGRTTSVSVLISDIQQQKADVIVNSTHTNLSLGTGGVSTAILKKCGPEVQGELKQEYPGGIEHGWVAESGPGQLTTCKAIYHGALPFWKGLKSVGIQECYIALVSLVYRCLIKASYKGYKSIAFPALGTGQLEYPLVSVVQLMYRAVRQFLQENKDTSLQEIYFVVHSKASLEMKQLFLAYSVTQRVSALPIDSTGDLHARLRASQTEAYEVLFRVGNTLVKVLNNDVKEACHPSSPVLVLWRPEEIIDPCLNQSVKCLSTGSFKSEDYKLVVANLEHLLVVSDPSSITSRTLIHCYCAGNKDNDVMTAVQHGLKQAQRHSCGSVCIPVSDQGRLCERPRSTAECVLKSVKKCSSCVQAVVVVIPDVNVFLPFVSMATELYKPLETADLDMKTIVEKTWTDSFAEWSRHMAEEALKEGNISVLTVTSDSEETNERIAMEIQTKLKSKILASSLR